jgi:hypothetical protein
VSITVVDYPDWGAETALAQFVSLTGVPLLAGLNPVLTVTPGTTVANGVTARFPAAGTLAVNQIGYEIVLSLESAGATCIAQIVLSWLDAAGTVVENDIWYTYTGTAGSPHVVYGQGPTNGTQFFIQVQAFTAGLTIDTLNLYENSRIYNYSDWRSRLIPGLANGGQTVAPASPRTLILGARKLAAQGAGATDNCNFCLYAGKVRLYGNTASHTTDLSLSLTDTTNQETTDQLFGQYFSDAHGNIAAELTLPRAQCVISMTNNNAGAQQTQWKMLIEEY